MKTVIRKLTEAYIKKENSLFILYMIAADEIKEVFIHAHDFDHYVNDADNLTDKELQSYTKATIWQCGFGVNGNGKGFEVIECDEFMVEFTRAEELDLFEQQKKWNYNEDCWVYEGLKLIPSNRYRDCRYIFK